MAIMMKSRMICKKHNFTVTVGSAVAFALDYYECPTCIAIEDAEYAESRRPCCSRMNIDCCGHDDNPLYDEQGEPRPFTEVVTWPLWGPQRSRLHVILFSRDYANEHRTPGDEPPF